MIEWIKCLTEAVRFIEMFISAFYEVGIFKKGNYSEGVIHKMPGYTFSLKRIVLAGLFVHVAVISYEFTCVNCSL